MHIDEGYLQMFTPEIWDTLKAEGFLLVPDELEDEARKAIAEHTGSSPVQVDLNGDSPLAEWARQERAARDRQHEADRKRRQKRKAAKRSRARNR